jgi:hypothetical protein
MGYGLHLRGRVRQGELRGPLLSIRLGLGTIATYDSFQTPNCAELVTFSTSDSFSSLLPTTVSRSVGRHKIGSTQSTHLIDTMAVSPPGRVVVPILPMIVLNQQMIV